MPLAKWNAFLKAAPPQQLLREVILESWHRSVDAGVDVSADHFDVPKVPPESVQQRLEANAVMVDVAYPHLEWLSASLGEIPHVAYVVDRDGIILRAIGVKTDLEASSLAPGYNWSEDVVGTNGAGTAIAANCPVAIIGTEHIVKPFHGFTCTGAPLHDAHGKVIGAIDVSTSAADGRPERLLAIAHAAFVIDRELADREALAAARAATAARDRLLAEVSHEIRTPLTAIVGWTQLLRENASGLVDGLREIESSAWRLSVLIADLLEATRLATGKMVLHQLPIDLVGVANDAVATLQPIAATKGVTVTLQATRPLIVNGDGPRLMQVVTNLVGNAIKFTPWNGRVHVTLEPAGSMARLVVTDTGSGIEESFLPFVFDYLRQDTRQHLGGLGLGLSIVRDVVQLHGGSVSAASEGHGKGATFTLELPLIDHPRETGN